MNNSKGIGKRLSLIGRYKIVKIDTKHDYKAEYNRMFAAKMSSSSFLLLYTLFLLNKTAEPLYGLEMLTEMRRGVNAGIWGPSHGTYYPLLEEMVKAKYIENVKTISGKKYYTITELGTEELELKLLEFRPMLIESSNFFSNILSEMYNGWEDKAVTTKTMRIEDKPESSSEDLLEGYSQLVEMLTSINKAVKELGTKIENQCIEVRIIKPVS